MFVHNQRNVLLRDCNIDIIFQCIPYLSEIMFCKKCGADIGDAKFCPKCGEATGAAAASATSTNVEHPDWKYVNKIAYGIIAILIGGFGIHRFYAGRIGSGILYLLFCWTGIPSILGLIEGIIALCANTDGDRLYVDPDKFFIS